jgi:hypothetical protein
VEKPPTVLLTLVCLAPHPLIPALAPGQRFTLEILAGGAFLATIPGNTTLLRQVVQTIGDGAVALSPDDPAPSFEEIAALVESERTDLMERAAAILTHSAPVSLDRAG